MAVVRATPPDVVRRDLLAAHAPRPLPAALRWVGAPGDAPVLELLARIVELLLRYWHTALLPYWPRIRLVLEADITHRAGQLATGGARSLFAGLHPNLGWRGGVLSVDKMIGRRRGRRRRARAAADPVGVRTQLAPPISAEAPPMLAYPGRGTATLWEPEPAPDASALTALLGAPRTTLLRLLAEPLPTVELARRLGVTPSAVSQHLRILAATGLVTRARDGRRVLYRRSASAERLVAGHPSFPARA
ncbi:ArsR/SmtB family transcription factor [Streptomyces lasalocidi]